MDIAAPVANTLKPQDNFQQIGNVLNFANQAQNLQRGNIDLQQNEIKLQERRGIQQLFSDPNRFLKSDGTHDYDKMIMGIHYVAPTTGPEIAPKVIQAFKDSALAQQSLNALNTDQLVRAGNIVGAMAELEPTNAFKQIDAIKEMHKGIAPALDMLVKYTLKPAAESGDPQVWKNAAIAAGRRFQTLAEQRQSATPTGNMVTNNSQAGFMNMNPQSGPVGIVPGSQFNLQLPMNERQNVQINPVTQSPMTVAKDAFTGNVQGVTQTPTGQGVPQLAPGQPQDIPIVTKERADVNAYASQIPTQRLNNREILKVLDTGTIPISGTGADNIAKILGSVGLQWTNNTATNTQNLAHYLALQSQNNAKAMGAGTDAAREVSSVATGNIAQTPDALRKVTKINDALSTGVEKFNEGMETAIKNNGGNVLAAREFKNAWSRAFDPDVYRYANALESKDNKEIDSILGKPGTPERASRAKALAAKSAILYQLSTQGR